MLESIIRDATDSDVLAIREIYAPYVIETPISFEMEPPDEVEMLRRLNRSTDRLPWIVLEHGSEILGYAYATQFRAREAFQNTAETTVYVSKDQQRQGVGRRLMEEVLARLRSAKFHRAVAGVTLPNAGSVGLHESLGFKQVGVFTQVGYKFDQWYDVGFWEFPLNATDWVTKGTSSAC